MYRVLLVDDEPMILEHTKTLVDWKALGCTIIGEAHNGEEGLALLRSLHPDFVITDVVMPGLTGLQMMDSASDLSDISYIFLSGYQEFDFVRHALRAGAVDYLLKPVEAADLRNALLRMMRRGQSAEEDYTARYGEIVAKVIMLIDEHYADPDFSLGGICENELFMNETYVGRLFQKRTRKKFTAWITEKRISEAKRMLTGNQDAPVADIAERVGFSTPKYFIEIFKKSEGISPSQYRQQQLQ
ncbi:MAG: response regulator [Clostridia bacterium]|nr:response regulator [Clostridia bacterium]